MADVSYRVADRRALLAITSGMARTAAEQLLNDVVEYTPRGDGPTAGTLAGGWHIVKRESSLASRLGDQWLVVNEVRWARPVEFGARGRPPVAMLGRAIAQARARHG